MTTPTPPPTASAATPNPTGVAPSGQLDNSSATELYKGQKSKLILVIGKSGRGKSTAMENLNPAETFLINILGKPLPFARGGLYREGENMLVATSSDLVRRKMDAVSREPKWKNLVIDDGHYVMATEFMNKAMEKGYDKFTLMAKNIFDIVLMCTKLRGDLKVFFLTHEEDTGSERKMKTLGKLLDDKVTLEGLSSIVLFADVVSDDQRRIYCFNTQSDGYTTAKSPKGMFPPKIPNDLELVSKRIDEYYQGVKLESSKLDFKL